MQQPKFNIFDTVTFPCIFRAEPHPSMTITKKLVGVIAGIRCIGGIGEDVADYRYTLKIGDYTFDSIEEYSIKAHKE